MVDLGTVSAQWQKDTPYKEHSKGGFAFPVILIIIGIILIVTFPVLITVMSNKVLLFTILAVFGMAWMSRWFR